MCGKGELLPHVLSGSGVNPLAVARCSHVVNVIIQSPSALVLAFLGCGHTAHVAPVVVAKQHYDIIGHTHTLVVVVHNLLIQSPNLRCFLGLLASDLLDNLALVGYNLFKQSCVSFLAHSLVAITTHTDSHDVVGAFHTFDTLTEELLDHLLVGVVVPCTVFIAVARPFLMVACHRLVVRRAYDDTHVVGSLLVERVVGIESPSPHCRPEHVSAQAQYKLKHLGIELMTAVLGLEGVLNPRRETWSLVVEEQSAIAHCRLAVGIYTFIYIYVLMLCHWHIGPPIPWRHTDLTREFVESVDGSAIVAARDEEKPPSNSPLGERLAVRYYGDYKLLGLAFQLVSEFVLF